MAADRQLELLEAIACALKVTPGVSGVRQTTVGRLFMLYKSSRPRGRAWQVERNLLRPFIVAHWRQAVSIISGSSWEAHRACRRTQRTRLGRAPCEATLNVELVRTRGMFAWGVRMKLIPSNPLQECRQVKTKNRRESWFTESQVATLADGARFLRWDHQQRVFRGLVAVMAWTGMRISEALGLRWDRIAVDGSVPVTGKGDKTRILAIPADVADVIAQLERHPESPFVFVNWKTGRPFDAWTVRQWFFDVIDATGLHYVKAKGDRKLVPHMLRHSFASNADARGAPLTLIQRCMGHSSSATTLIYVHREETDAALRMAKIMTVRRSPKRAAQKSGESRRNFVDGRQGRGVPSFS